MRHVVLISGKDSLATALVQTKSEPDLPYEFIHNDTGWDLPETLEWLAKVEKHLGIEIYHCGDDLTEISYEQNCLPLPMRRFCTRLAKIKPLNDYLGTDETTVYFGLRADEPDRVGYVPPVSQKLIPAYPLRDHGYGLNEVWKLCEDAGLLPPAFHWQWIEDKVREILGRDQYLLDKCNPWEQRMLLAWRSRANCDRCFYSGQYEKIGLYEHHPDRFESAVQMEKDLCWGQSKLTWMVGYKLPDLIPRAEEIKLRRARNVVKYLRKKQIKYLFDNEPADDLAATSCGLLCGK